MSVRGTPFIVGEYYHLYNRGILKNNIFLNNHDKDRLLKLLFICNGSNPVVFRDVQELPLAEIERGNPLVDIGAYCFMPNHFHILARERVQGGISAFMEKMATGYVMYFNKKHERTGRLFEGTFKSRHIDDEAYLHWLFTYIHLNPVKLIESKWKETGIHNPTKARNYLNDYKYSSYADYFLGKRNEELILNKSVFPEAFRDMDDFRILINEWRGGRDQEESTKGNPM